MSVRVRDSNARAWVHFGEIPRLIGRRVSGNDFGPPCEGGHSKCVAPLVGGFANKTFRERITPEWWVAREASGTTTLWARG